MYNKSINPTCEYARFFEVTPKAFHPGQLVAKGWQAGYLGVMG